MDTDRVLNLGELRSALGRVLDELERRHGQRIELGADYYWTLDPSDPYKFDAAAQPEITVSHLGDDVDSMLELLQRDPEEPVIVWHDLGHLVGILRRLAATDLPSQT